MCMIALARLWMFDVWCYMRSALGLHLSGQRKRTSAAVTFAASRWLFKPYKSLFRLIHMAFRKKHRRKREKIYSTYRWNVLTNVANNMHICVWTVKRTTMTTTTTAAMNFSKVQNWAFNPSFITVRNRFVMKLALSISFHAMPFDEHNVIRGAGT